MVVVVETRETEASAKTMLRRACIDVATTVLGMPPDDLMELDSELDAVREALDWARSGDLVIALGWIQPDGTVKGGTGWGVELAKLFNRPLSVYDQERDQWFAWKDKQWVEETPVITDKTFAGTGTGNPSTVDACSGYMTLLT